MKPARLLRFNSGTLDSFSPQLLSRSSPSNCLFPPQSGVELPCSYFRGADSTIQQLRSPHQKGGIPDHRLSSITRVFSRPVT